MYSCEDGSSFHLNGSPAQLPPSPLATLTSRFRPSRSSSVKRWESSNCCSVKTLQNTGSLISSRGVRQELDNIIVATTTKVTCRIVHLPNFLTVSFALPTGVQRRVCWNAGHITRREPQARQNHVDFNSTTNYLSIMW